jgi:hypothetical protein
MSVTDATSGSDTLNSLFNMFGATCEGLPVAGRASL